MRKIKYKKYTKIIINYKVKQAKLNKQKFIELLGGSLRIIERSFVLMKHF